ncbi:MAG: hypothetical protein Q9170_001287 [Blastenia crenularia]
MDTRNFKDDTGAEVLYKPDKAIVDQQSLVQLSSTGPEGTDKICDHTSGLAFLGTPFEGSATAGWTSFFEKLSGLSHIGKVNKSLLDHLQKDSHELKILGEEFPKWLMSRQHAEGKNVRVICFFEELPTQVLGYIVPRDSARIAGFDCVSLPSDHSEMCKFDNFKDPKYIIVLSTLSKWVEDLKVGSEDKETATVSWYSLILSRD